MNLTAHFTLAEFTHSQHAIRYNIDNTPNETELARIQYLALRMEDVRALLNVPIIISSGFRAPALNLAVGGAANSQHMRGEAADFTAPAFGDPLGVCRVIERSEIEFDQLIWEGGWTHISFVPRGQRREVLTATFNGGRVTYSRGIA